MVAYDLVVIGGGYWGSAIAYEGSKLGWKTVVLDDRDPLSGSRAASGICDPQAYRSPTFRRYLPTSWTDSDLEKSFEWLLSVGGVKTREWFWNIFENRQPREGVEAIYLPDVSTVTRLAPLWIQRRVTQPFGYRRLAVAAGYRTDEVLSLWGISPLGVGNLYGRGLTVTGTPKVPTPISGMIRPYTKHTVRTWKGGWKVGDTAEKTPGIPGKLETLRKVGRAVLRDYREVSVSEGYRPVLDQFTVEKVARNTVVATGGHRLGLGLCGLVTRKVLEALK